MQVGAYAQAVNEMMTRHAEKNPDSDGSEAKDIPQITKGYVMRLASSGSPALELYEVNLKASFDMFKAALLLWKNTRAQRKPQLFQKMASL